MKIINFIKTIIKKILFKYNLKQKLLIAFLITSCLPVLIAAIFSLLFFFDLSLKDAKSNLQDKLHMTKLLLEKKESEMEKIAIDTSLDNLLILNMDLILYSSIKEYLFNIEKNKNLSFLSILDKDGNVIIAGNYNTKFSYSLIDQDTLNSCIEHGSKVFITRLNKNIFLGNENSQNQEILTILSIATIHNYQNELLGFVVAGVRLDQTTTIEKNIPLIKEIRENVGAPVIITDNGKIIYYSEGNINLINNRNNKIKIIKNEFVKILIDYKSYIYSFYKIETNDNKDGAGIGIGFVEYEYIKARNKAGLFLALIILLGIGISIFLALILAKNITKPIISMVEGTNSIVEGNFDKKIQVESEDEIGLLAMEFNIMTTKLKETLNNLKIEIKEKEIAEEKIIKLNEELEKRVTERTEQLELTNTTLENTIVNLENAHEHIVQSEKMAALGVLVAGISHEINTPIGVGVTAASFLEEKTMNLRKLYDNDNIKQSDMEDYLKSTLKSSEIILSNLLKASDLIKSFKQVAVDRQSELKRVFNVKQYINEILQSLQPQLKKYRHTIVLDIQKNLEINSYPGVFSQIITNLIINSITHGFENIEKGEIEINIKTEKKLLFLIYSDNGNGITKENLKKIFEPFFTTKRGKGGSGLGLNIVYNLVTQKLNGKIDCTSTPGQGTTFMIKLPL